MAALLRMLCHRMPTSTVPMLRTEIHPFSRPLFLRILRFLMDASLDPQRAKIPTIRWFTSCAGYLKIADGKQFTLLYTSEVI